MMITECVGLNTTRLITSLPYNICQHSLVILHRLHMVLDTPDKCRMETMDIEIISSINLIVNMRNIGNVNMVEKVEAMVSIDGIMMID